MSGACFDDDDLGEPSERARRCCREEGGGDGGCLYCTRKGGREGGRKGKGDGWMDGWMDGQRGGIFAIGRGRKGGGGRRWGLVVAAEMLLVEREL